MEITERVVHLLAPVADTEASGGQKPLDIAAYTAALGQLHATLKESGAVLGTVQVMLGSTLLADRLSEVNHAARDRVEHASLRVNETVNQLAWRVALLLLLTALLIAALLWWQRRLRRTP
jgi:hypothetical protein